MTDSLSFDRAADFYDKTRDFPEPVATQGIQAILDVAGPGARILDAGTGTGRVSVPLLKRRADLFGVDLSTRMMSRLREKFSSARLAKADVSQLPFPGKIFDAVLTCHVMHLVGPWREALREYRRVLKPAGKYINAYSDNIGESLQIQVRDRWRELLKEHGFTSQRIGAKDEKEVAEVLKGMGAELKEISVVEYVSTSTVRQEIDRIASRALSHSWAIPDSIFAESLVELNAWAKKEYPDWDRPFEEKNQFILDVATFEN
jgi:ubiquinone/menaquinone biosynthesis C-methylase UbiE